MDNAYMNDPTVSTVTRNRPLSAPKAGGNKRVSSVSRKRPRAQSGRFKQIKQYLSEQEAINQQ